jgi:hypothetical protein
MGHQSPLYLRMQKFFEGDAHSRQEAKGKGTVCLQLVGRGLARRYPAPLRRADLGTQGAELNHRHADPSGRHCGRSALALDFYNWTYLN